MTDHQPVLGIDASTRQGLLRELAQRFAMLRWEYAPAPDDALAGEARGLKAAPRDALEAGDAA